MKVTIVRFVGVGVMSAVVSFGAVADDAGRESIAPTGEIGVVARSGARVVAESNHLKRKQLVERVTLGDASPRVSIVSSTRTHKMVRPRSAVMQNGVLNELQAKVDEVQRGTENQNTAE